MTDKLIWSHNLRLGTGSSCSRCFNRLGYVGALWNLLKVAPYINLLSYLVTYLLIEFGTRQWWYNDDGDDDDGDDDGGGGDDDNDDDDGDVDGGGGDDDDDGDGGGGDGGGGNGDDGGDDDDDCLDSARVDGGLQERGPQCSDSAAVRRRTLLSRADVAQQVRPARRRLPASRQAAHLGVLR